MKKVSDATILKSFVLFWKTFGLDDDPLIRDLIL